MKWYKGPTLVDLIDKLEPPPRSIDQPTRFMVADVYKDALSGLGNAVGGKLEAGYVSKGDRLLLLPLGEVCTVKAIHSHDQHLDAAGAGQNVELGITGIEFSSVTTGSILCDPIHPMPMATRFRAQLLTFGPLPVPILKGTQTTLHFHNVQVPATVARLISILDSRTGEVKQKKPKAIGAGMSAVVIIQLERPLCLELYANYKQLGRFTLRDQGKTLGAGIVTKLITLA